MQSRNLDLLRALAVSFVVLSHIGVNLRWGEQVLDVGAIGRVGVSVFFVHTAYVLMQSLERHQAGAMAFYVRRVFRIYPLAIAAVLASAAITLAAGSALDLRMLASNLLLVQNITGHKSDPAQLWSLPFEVQMYLLLPALFALTKTARPLPKIALLWALGVALASSGAFPLLNYVPCFMGGVFAYALSNRARTVSPHVLFAGVLAAALVVSALVAAGWSELPMHWALCIALGLALPFVREIQPGWIARAGALGARYSYSIYLTHLYALAAAFFAFPLPALLQWVVFFVVLAMMVRVADYWIEQPGIALGKRLADRIGQKTAKKSDDRPLDGTTLAKENTRVCPEVHPVSVPEV